MSEYKFSCPNCDQHLSGTPAWAGRSLTCPTCKKEFTVPPPAPGAAPVAVAVTATARPAGPPVRTPIRAADLPRAPGAAPAPAPAPAPAAGGSNGLAVASLVCGIASFLFGCLSGLPAVICGHLALSRLKSGRATTGRGMAIAGLVMGYFMLLCTLVVAILWAVMFRQIFQQVQADMQRNQPPGRSVPVVPDRNLPPGRNGPGGLERAEPGRQRTDRTTRPPRNQNPAGARVAANDPQVATDPATASIPGSRLSGTVGGQPFKCDKAEFNSFMKLLTIQEGTDMMADKNIKIFFFPKDNEAVLGRTWTFAPGDDTSKPHVRFSGGGQGGAEMRNYAMKIELSQPQGGKVNGKLYLELPQSTGTKLAGTFQAVVEK
jgi:hypothetical protein